MNKKIKDMTNKELFKEFEAYDQMINNIGCYGVRDMIYYNRILEEINIRDLRITVKYKLIEDD
jgi:hypothetical protein